MLQHYIPLSFIENLLVEAENVLHERLPLTAVLGRKFVVLVNVPRVAEGAPVVAVDKVLLVGVEKPDAVAADEGDDI